MERVRKLVEPNLAVIQEVKKESLLRKIVIFRDLSPKSLSIIEQRIQTLEVKKGEAIIKEVSFLFMMGR
ncbi:hypothetical protein [Neobacillus rhizophilus]|uniref:hypothetical protein n=1 Tax=Neobacillus rhizophilus TaxID=2833579 RepID=UPI00201754DC|nr:hypothetical protein [Neobacillus rhizophilus]